jgi:DNA-binding beta-propeller fold protein YncE
VTITATADPAFSPARNQITIELEPGQVMESIAVYRNQAGTRELIRQQPAAGFDFVNAYDYEALYEVPASYSAEIIYLGAGDVVFSEAWAALTAWTVTNGPNGGTWSVSGGKLARSGRGDILANVTHALTPGRYQIRFLTPPTGVSTIDFGGFSIDVEKSRLVVGTTSTTFVPGTGEWLIEITPTAVGITTTAGNYSLTANVEATRIQIIAPAKTRTHLRKFTTTDQVRALAYNPVSGEIIALDHTLGRARRYNPTTGAFLGYVGTGTTGSGNGQLNDAWSVACGADGSIYIAETGNIRVQKFTSAGAYVTKWGTSGSADGQFSDPSGIAVHPVTGNVWVTDWIADRVQVFTPTGTFVSKFGNSGSTNGNFDRAYHLAFDSAGNAYILDAGNNRVQKFTAAGVYSTKWGTYGSGNGQLNNPNGIAVDTSGYVYVTDASSRIQMFSSTGSYLETVATNGTANGFVRDTNGLTVGANVLYVGDSGNTRIQGFGTYTTAVDDITVSAYERPVTTTLNSADVTLAPATAWMIHPARPALSVPVFYDDLERAGLRDIGPVVNRATSTVHSVLGSAKSIAVTTGPRQDDAVRLVIATRTAAERQAIKGLVADQWPILIRVPPSWELDFDEGYFAVGDVEVSRLVQSYATPARLVALPLEAVESPIVSQENTGWSWAALVAEFPTWADVYTAFETWADVLVNNRRPGY